MPLTDENVGNSGEVCREENAGHVLRGGDVGRRTLRRPVPLRCAPRLAWKARLRSTGFQSSPVRATRYNIQKKTRHAFLRSIVYISRNGAHACATDLVIRNVGRIVQKVRMACLGLSNYLKSRRNVPISAGEVKDFSLSAESLNEEEIHTHIVPNGVNERRSIHSRTT